MEPFPIDVYPPTIQAFVVRATDSIGCSQSFLAAGVLPVFGAALGGEVTIRLTESWTEAPRIWLALVAPPGAKKTPAMKMLTSPLWAIEHDLHQGNEVAIEAWEHQPSKDRGKPPTIRHAIVADTTIEALCDTLRDNKRLLCHNDELIGLLKGFGRYNDGPDRQHWLSIWSGADLKVQRKSRPLGDLIRDPFVSVLGSIQPKLLPKLSGDDGLFPRFLFAFGESQVTELQIGGKDQPIEYVRYRDTVKHLFHQPATEVPLADASHDYAREVYRYLSKKAAGQDGLAEVHSKMLAYWARFALILNLLDTVTMGAVGPVSADQLHRGLKLVEWFTANAALAKAEDDGSTQKDRERQKKLEVLQSYLTRHPGVDFRTALRNGPQWSRDKMALLTALNALGVKLPGQEDAMRNRAVA